MKNPVVALLALLVSVGVFRAQASRTFDLTLLDPVVADELHQTRAPGAAVAVVSNGRVVLARGFGVANVETNEPVRPEMLFRLGSTTKMFTAAALLVLAEQGRLDLNEPIGRYVPGLSPRIAKISAHQLLSHTSGLLDDAPMFGSNDDEALGREVRLWKDDRFFTEAGMIYSYSNPGYWLAGYVSESLSGKPFADQVAASLFVPLGMARTTFRPSVAMTYPLAQGHELTNREPRVIRPAANNAASWPAGSIFSSVTDLSRWMMALVDAGQIEGRQAVPPEVIARLQAGTTVIPGSDYKYAYGLQVGTTRGVQVVRHGGSRSGYGSVILTVPAHRFGVVALANLSGVSLNRTAEKAMEIVLGLGPAAPPSERRPVPMGATEMAALVGSYSQGLRRVELVSREGRVFLLQGTKETVVQKVGEHEIAAGKTRFTLVPDDSGGIAYLHAVGRSWRKVAPRP